MSADIQDALAQVGRALRIAASQDADRAWWDTHRAAVARNHEAMYLHAATLLHAVETGTPPSSGMQMRLRAALDERDLLRSELSKRINGRDE